MTKTSRSRFCAASCALFVVLIGLLATASARAQGGAGWTEITAAAGGPSARAGHTLTSVGGEAWLFGGLAASALNDLWRFDSASGAFVQVNAANPPPARRNHAAAAFGGKLFVFGGLGSTGGQFLDDVWSYDPSANAWTEVTSQGSRPEARAFHQVISNGERIYLGGGFGTSSNGAFIDRWEFNPTTSTWRRLFPEATKGVVQTNLIVDPCGRYGVFATFLQMCSIFGPAGTDCLALAAVTFGGESFEDDLKLETVNSDVHQMDLASGGFKPVTTSGDTPPGLVLGAVATFAPRSDGGALKAILIGGELGGGQRSNKTFLIEGEPETPVLRFTAGPELPLTLSETGATYIPDFPFAGRAAGPAVLVFGGRLSSDVLSSRAFVLPAEAAPASPDLTGTWTGSPTAKCKNNKCRISGTFVARNSGTVGAGATTVTFYLSTDGALDAGDTMLRTDALPALAVDATATFDLRKKQRLKLPNGATASGKFIIAFVESAGAVDEGNEGNNAVAAGPLP